MIRRCLLMLILCAAVAAPLRGDNLGDILKQHEISSLPPGVRAKAAISGAVVLSDPAWFAVAYYDVNGSNLEAPLRVALLEKSSQTWRQAQLLADGAANPEEDSFCLGAAVSFEHQGEWFYLATRLSPSASCTMVLKSDLKVRKTVYGWVVAHLGQERVIVQQSVTHFAVSHPLRLELFEATSGKETPLLPLEGDSVRREFEDKVEEVADLKWCEQNNASCEGQDLEGDLSVIEVAPNNQRVVMRIEYGGRGFGPKAEAMKTTAIYLLDLRQPEVQHREFTVEELAAAGAESDPKRILQPEPFQKIWKLERKVAPPPVADEDEKTPDDNPPATDGAAAVNNEEKSRPQPAQ